MPKEQLFYLQDSRQYVGNDILWWARNGAGYTTSLLDGRTRPAVAMQYVDRKDALKGSGVKIIKPKRKRPTTGKTRGNCPTCGKITWDYNPYENAPCREHERGY